ncbi:MAG: LysR substrate-binding domain-containing protein [Pseudomonadota bacterium]
MPRFNFTIKQLRYIEAAGRLGSIAHAASELNISQSSITSAIDGLENEVGFDLFIRTRAKGLQTTSGGEQVLTLIRRFIQQSRHFEADVRSVGGMASGTVRIAIYGTSAPSFLPVILDNVTKKFPQLSVKIMEGTLPTVMDFVSEGEADLAFTYEMATDARHRFYPLLVAPPYALFSANDPLGQRASITMEELSTHPMILLDLPVARYFFTSLYTARNLKPKIAHTTQSSEIARALVSAGFGHTLLNMRPPGYEKDDTRFRAVPISNCDNAPKFGMATIEGTRQPEVVQTFMKNCLEMRDDGAFEPLIIQ